MAEQLQLVISHNSRPTTTSLLIAQRFGKEHRNVLQAIENLECSVEFRALNFQLSSYRTKQNKEMPMYIITRDGFTRLVMSFTGLSAARFKEEFIEQFNRMEEQLRKPLLETYTKRIMSEETKNVPRGYWCVFDASHRIMLWIQKNVGCVSKYDLVDGSIGTKWSRYREGKEWAADTSTFIYEFEDNRGNRECKCYNNAERGYFDDWLQYEYQPLHLYPYLTDKFTKERNYELLARVKDSLPKLLK